jgi:hypothetical protein
VLRRTKRRAELLQQYVSALKYARDIAREAYGSDSIGTHVSGIAASAKLAGCNAANRCIRSSDLSKRDAAIISSAGQQLFERDAVQR